MKQTTSKTEGHFFPIKTLAETIVMVALAGVLSLISHVFYALPQGGSINLGMIPILWLALRRGPKIGVFAGSVFGLVDLAIEPFVVSPIQFVLDYPLAFACIGVAGFFKKLPVLGAVVSTTGRFVCHFVSGVVYFSENTPAGMSSIVYSAIYNGSYMVPSIIICAIIIGILKESNTIDIYL